MRNLFNYNFFFLYHLLYRYIHIHLLYPYLFPSLTFISSPLKLISFIYPHILYPHTFSSSKIFSFIHHIHIFHSQSSLSSTFISFVYCKKKIIFYFIKYEDIVQFFFSKITIINIS